jgi:hypothetical protein
MLADLASSVLEHHPLNGMLADFTFGFSPIIIQYIPLRFKSILPLTQGRDARRFGVVLGLSRGDYLSLLELSIYWRRVEAEDLRGAFPPFRYMYSGGCLRLRFGPVVSVWSRPARAHRAADISAQLRQDSGHVPVLPTALSVCLEIRCHVFSS